MAASVILAKCEDGRTFGIRVEKRENDWVRTWAFPIDEGKAKREGFDKNTVNGSLQATSGYPGCPYCGTFEFVQCGCGKISCYHESRTERSVERKPDKKSGNKHDRVSFRCPWCGRVAKEIETVESFHVKSGGY